MQEKTGMPIRSRLVMSATRVMPAAGYFWLYAGECLFERDGPLGLIVVGLLTGLELHGVTRGPGISQTGRAWLSGGGRKGIFSVKK